MAQRWGNLDLQGDGVIIAPLLGEAIACTSVQDERDGVPHPFAC